MPLLRIAKPLVHVAAHACAAATCQAKCQNEGGSNTRWSALGHGHWGNQNRKIKLS